MDQNKTLDEIAAIALSNYLHFGTLTDTFDYMTKEIAYAYADYKLASACEY